MKEHTYGWYPSAKNVYEERRMGALTPYQLEALYRYKDSKYYQPPITPPEQRSNKPPSTTGHRPESTGSRASSKAASQKSTHSSKVNLQLRATSAPIHTTYKRPPKLIIPTPQQCWSTHVPETEITVAPPQTPAPSRASVPLPRSTTPHATTPVPEVPVDTYSEQVMQKIVRIRSATVRRDSTSRPQRPTKSAGPVRPSPTYDADVTSVQALTPTQLVSPYNYDQTTRVHMPETPPPTTGYHLRPPSSKHAPSRSSIPSPAARPPSGQRTPLRPKAPSPYQMDLHMEDNECRSGTPDYDAERQKHGWMMEVHGDPLKLKKVAKRLPYTVQCEEPETERDPPKVHMENLETFFLNTIPRRPMAFTIDKEWISEMIHKKRMDSQKEHGINYRYKNFSFVY